MSASLGPVNLEYDERRAKEAQRRVFQCISLFFLFPLLPHFPQHPQNQSFEEIHFSFINNTLRLY